MCVCVYVRVRVYMCVCMYMRACICMCVYARVCIYVHMRVCVCVYIYICIYIPFFWFLYSYLLWLLGYIKSFLPHYLCPSSLLSLIQVDDCRLCNTHLPSSWREWLLHSCPFRLSHPTTISLCFPLYQGSDSLGVKNNNSRGEVEVMHFPPVLYAFRSLSSTQWAGK